MSLQQAADRLGVSKEHYHEAENDVLPETEITMLLTLALGNEALDVTDGERCLLARRRSGIKFEEMRLALKISPVTLIRRESAADPRIIMFWVKKGYTFKGLQKI